MDTRQRLSGVLAAIVIGGASVGVSHATAGPEWAASTPALAADTKQSQATPTPTHVPGLPSVGYDLIYDIVGPSPIDPGVKTR
jgi:hypothetical protein